jgi:hypothetical protein
MILAVASFADLDELRAAFVAQQSVLTAERAPNCPASAPSSPLNGPRKSGSLYRTTVCATSFVSCSARSLAGARGRLTRSVHSGLGGARAGGGRRRGRAAEARPCGQGGAGHKTKPGPCFAARSFAANRTFPRARGHGLPVLRRRDACHR